MFISKLMKTLLKCGSFVMCIQTKWIWTEFLWCYLNLLFVSIKGWEIWLFLCSGPTPPFKKSCLTRDCISLWFWERYGFNIFDKFVWLCFLISFSFLDLRVMAEWLFCYSYPYLEQLAWWIYEYAYKGIRTHWLLFVYERCLMLSFI